MAHKFKETYNKLKTNRINKLVVITLRIIVGAVFIFSGFVKAIDVMGSVYKFQEYIAVLNLTSLTGSEVVLAFGISILDLTLVNWVPKTHHSPTSPGNDGGYVASHLLPCHNWFSGRLWMFW